MVNVESDRISVLGFGLLELPEKPQQVLPPFRRHLSKDCQEFRFVGRLRYSSRRSEPEDFADRIDVVARLLLAVEDLGCSALRQAGLQLEPPQPLATLLEGVAYAGDPLRRDLTPGACLVLPRAGSRHPV